MAATSRLSSFKPNIERVHAEPDVSSSSFHDLDQRPSTSAQREISVSENENLLENTRRVSFTSTVDLADASMPTHNGMNLNPMRDGVFARVQRVIFGKLAPAAAGVAIGAGIVELANSTNLFKPSTMNPDLENINIIG